MSLNKSGISQVRTNVADRKRCLNKMLKKNEWEKKLCAITSPNQFSTYTDEITIAQRRWYARHKRNENTTNAIDVCVYVWVSVLVYVFYAVLYSWLMHWC